MGELVASLLLLGAQFSRDLTSTEYSLRSSAGVTLEQLMIAVRHVSSFEAVSPASREYLLSNVLLQGIARRLQSGVGAEDETVRRV